MSTIIKSQKITPFLWFNGKAEEALNFYTTVFPNTEITQLKKWGEGTPIPADQINAGSILIEGFCLNAFDAGPMFQLNPSISFFVHCDTVEEVEKCWQKLAESGNALMPLDTYPFSEKYGWIVDKFGISWQIILSNGQAPQKIMPSFLFTGENAGKAEEAMNLYTTIFQNAAIKGISRYDAGQEPNKEGTVAYGDFTLEGQMFAAMDSAQNHGFTFNEAISMFVACKGQEEVDYFWEKFLIEGGKESQCGWLKDKYGVSWQIVPDFFMERVISGERAKVQNMMQAVYQMKKLDVAALEEAYNQ